MTQCLFPQCSWDILPSQISGANKEGKSFCPRIVGCFTLCLDGEIAVFHSMYIEVGLGSCPTLPRYRIYSSFRFRVIFLVVPSVMDSGTIIGVEAMDSAWAASEGVVSGAGSRSSSTVSSILI